MKAKIQKWGNGLGEGLPKDIVEKVSADNLHQETEWSGVRGNEVW